MQYGQYQSIALELFSAPISSSSFSPKGSLPRCQPLRQSLNWPSLHLAHNNQRCGMEPLETSFHCPCTGSGISTRCPSATPSGLALGTALPPSDEHSRRNLRFSAYKILTCIIATHACILTRVRSTCAYAQASPLNTTLPYRSSCDDPVASGIDFSPLTFSAQVHIRPVSCYALFKGWLLPSQPPGC